MRDHCLLESLRCLLLLVPLAGTPALAQVVEEWDSPSFGHITVDRSGSGAFNFKGGRISGSWTGSEFKGVWTQETSKRRCSRPAADGRMYWGGFVFRINGDNLSGGWSYCELPAAFDGSLSAVRSKNRQPTPPPTPQSQGIEGHWAVNFNGFRGTMDLARSGNGWTGKMNIGQGIESLDSISFDSRTGAVAFHRSEGNQHYAGSLSGNSMSGQFDSTGRKGYSWSATRQGPTPPPPPKPSLTVSIVSDRSSAQIGQQVTTTAKASGGAPPYRYQWFVDAQSVAVNAASLPWTPSQPGPHTLRVVVKDSAAQQAEAQSTVAVQAAPPPSPRPNPLADRLLSQGRPTRMSPNGAPAPGGNDGIKDGKYGFITPPDTHPWWDVDLGTNCMISEVRIYNSQSYRPFDAKYLQVRFSSDDNSWVAGYTHDGSTPPYPLRLTFQNQIARWVRIVLMDQNLSLHLDEVEVYGHGASGAQPPGK